MDTITDIEAATPRALGADQPLGELGLVQLLAWLSPSFPVGAFSYSHGIEYAVETGRVTDRKTLQDWIAALVSFGSGRVDAALFLAAHEAMAEQDDALLEWVLERGDALRATREFGVETEGQGTAFLAAVARAWPHPELDRVTAFAGSLGRPVVYPAAVGAAAAVHGLSRRDALSGYLHAFAANLVSAGVRLVPLGQSDGLQVIAGLEPVLLGAVAVALARSRDDLGSATVLSDWASASHETQYTRLFRS